MQLLIRKPQQVLQKVPQKRDLQIQKNEEPVYITAEDIEISTNEIPGFEVAVKAA